MGLFDFMRRPVAGESGDTGKKSAGSEYGVTGLRIASGYIYEEFLQELSGDRGRRVYREMTDNDAVCGSIITAIDALLRAIPWTFEPNPKDTTAEGATWLTETIGGMDHTWESFISEMLTMLTFGWAYHEIVYKKRDDGTIGLAKLAPRAQESLLRWELTPTGEVIGMHQLDPNGAAPIFIPREKALHFVTTSRKMSPEGRSILRNAYTSYWFKKQIQIIEAIAIERELAGLPVIKVPSDVLTNPDMAPILAKYVRMARDLKFNDQGGIIMPSDTYKDEAGRPGNVAMFSVELLSASGTRSIDMNGAIVRYQQDIARTILADFLILGSSSRGSFALSKSKTDLFLRSLEGYTANIAAELNKDLIPKLWKINGFDPDTMPIARPGQVAPTDLDELGNYLMRISQAGFQLAGDPETEKKVRQAADLPGSYIGDGSGSGTPHESFPTEEDLTVETVPDMEDGSANGQI